MLSRKEIREIAKEVAKILQEQQEENTPYQYTAEEKAKQLHISLEHLYKVKDRYPHRRVEGSRRLFFR